MPPVTRTPAIRALLLTACAGAALSWFLQRTIEDRVWRELQRTDAATGARLTADAVHFSWLGPLRIDGLRVDGSWPSRASARRVHVDWTFAGGRDPLAHVRSILAEGLDASGHGLRVEVPRSRWTIEEWSGTRGAGVLRLREVATAGELRARWRQQGAGPGHGVVLDIGMSALDVGNLCRVSWHDQPVGHLGRWTMQAGLERGAESTTSSGTLGIERMRLSRTDDGGAVRQGAATDVSAAWDASLKGRALDVRRLRASFGGLKIDASGRVEDRGSGAGEARDLWLDVEASAQAQMATVLAAAALDLPASLKLPREDLGNAALEMKVRGSAGDASALESQARLSFQAPPAAVAALAFLRGPFHHTAVDESGTAGIHVGPGTPGFVALADVPPVFLRALLLSEDSNFYGHPGIDVAEIPIALATNIERGTRARGASTITQQLVKNLFLSRQKSYDRKTAEAALSLLVDASVPKPRLLEIYLNIIQWGPGIHGLGAAADHYFGKAPAALTPKESAFLICLIPSPVRYHQAHVAGRAGPGMQQLMTNLLAKLLSVGALDAASYEAAVAEPLAFRPEGS